MKSNIKISNLKDSIESIEISLFDKINHKALTHILTHLDYLYYSVKCIKDQQMHYTLKKINRMIDSVQTAQELSDCLYHDTVNAIFNYLTELINSLSDTHTFKLDNNDHQIDTYKFVKDVIYLHDTSILSRITQAERKIIVFVLNNFSVCALIASKINLKYFSLESVNNSLLKAIDSNELTIETIKICKSILYVTNR